MAKINSRLSTKQRIINYLTYRGAVSGSELERRADDWSTKASVIARRARELAHEGRIERFIINKTVNYRIPRARMSTFEANQYLEKLKLEERERQVSIL